MNSTIRVFYALHFLCYFPSHAFAIEGADALPISQALAETIDSSEYDIDTLVESLNYDSDELVAFVQTRIAFEQYPGVLRGAIGTLMSKAGNALDQSLLLATILKDAGYDARILRGRLSNSQTRALLQRLGRREPFPVREPDSDHIAEVYDHLAEVLGITTARLRSLVDASEPVNDPVAQLPKKAEDESAWLLSLLRDQNIHFDDASINERLFQETKDYYWVEFREAESSPWLEAHPSFGNTSPIGGIAPLEVFDGSVPVSLQHRFQIQFFVEQQSLDSINRLPLSDPLDLAVGNIFAKPLTYSFVSAGITASLLNQDSISTTLAVPHVDTDLFFLRVNGRILSKAFDSNGNVVPMSEAASMYGALFATASDKISQAAKSLSDLGGQESDATSRATALRALIVEYTFISPTGSQRKHERVLYDKSALEILPSAKRDLERYRNITRQFSLMVNSGRIPSGYVLEELLNLISQRALAIDEAGRISGLDALSKLSLHDKSWEGHLPLYAAFARSNTNTVVYRDQAALVVHHKSLAFDGNIREAVDIVQSPHRSFGDVTNDLKFDFESNIVQGVWESIAESAVFKQLYSSGVRDTLSIFEAARASNASILVLTADRTEQLENMNMATETRRQIVGDLRAGMIVVLPDSVLSPMDYAWWRIDPTNGSTLGRSWQGEGAVTIEEVFAKTVAGAVVGALFYFHCIDAVGQERAKEKGLVWPPEQSSDRLPVSSTLGCAVCSAFAGALAGYAVGLQYSGAAVAKGRFAAAKFTFGAIAVSLCGGG